ncbi:hypothetical protein HID58_090651 [Brassica napus]|uniref:Uncharacterized protein n=1 Tax=Brassica napus TaxID=3708 RepID=A0ABQ7XC10_BRANA|nr:hypothetical protein HID58_090651 [Brassica napus]
MCDYNVGQIGLQVHGGAPGMSIPYLTLLSLPVMFWYLRFIGFVSAARGKSHHIHDPMKEAQRLFMSWLLPTLKSEPTKAVEPVRGPNTSHGHEALPHHAGPLGSQHRERQRIGGNDGCSGLGGISNYSPKSLFPPEKVIALHPRFRFSDPCCFRISAGGEIGAAQLLRGGKEHVMMFN